MKYIFVILLLTSCGAEKHKEYGLYISNGEGLYYSSTHIKCDSFKMESPQSAVIYSNGTAMPIKASLITPYTP